mmetsp:Transcript_8555/g.1179  ORF Transcript_8555/g.1179 Transcript_8555/m.1179 type:complete len:168 (+) Transcript_8555:246-749(+)
MGMGNSFLITAQFMKVCLIMENPMELEGIYRQMGITTMGNDTRERSLGMESLCASLRDIFTKEIGCRICKMERELKDGTMALRMKEILWTVKNMGLEHLNGRMEAFIKEVLSRTLYKAMGNMNGQMEESMKDGGNLAKCMAKGNSNGLVEKLIQEFIKRINGMDLEF